ncbi:MFS transporter [candidate division KSB1 bacterium]|nr:MFS transporter [candidate division KSB1 bacterium]
MYNRRLVFWAACLGMLIFGIVLTTLGASLPSLIEKFGLDKARAGSLMALMSVGILLGSVIFGPVVDYAGYKGLLILCTFFIFIGLEGIALALNLGSLQFAIFLIGFSGGIINGGANALVADISEAGKSANLSFLGVFFGIGAIGVPLLLGILLNHLSYQIIIAAVGMIVLGVFIFFTTLRFPAPKHAQGLPIKEGLRLLDQLTLLLFGVLLFFESGMEITVGNWSGLFLKEELVLEPNRAVLFLSFYWLGMVCSRLILGYVLKKYSSASIQFTCLGVAFIGAMLLIFSQSLALSSVGLFLVGCGLAAGFPVMLGYVGNLYAHLSGTAFSIVLVIALIGGTLFPYFTGILGQHFGLRLSFAIIPVSLVLMAWLFRTVLNRIAASKK